MDNTQTKRDISEKRILSETCTDRCQTIVKNLISGGKRAMSGRGRHPAKAREETIDNTRADLSRITLETRIRKHERIRPTNV